MSKIKEIMILADTLQGEINRMCVTKSLTEFDTMYGHAKKNLDKLSKMIYHDRFDAESEEHMQIEKLGLLFKAQQEAEEKGVHIFTCPNCKHMAWWDRAKINGHIRIRCDGCGVSVME